MKSSLTDIQHLDIELERLRQRVKKSGEGYDLRSGCCGRCSVKLTEADVEAGECTNCGAVLEKEEDDDARN